MKESIQHKIDLIMQLAKTSVKGSAMKDVEAFRASNDSLSKSIRNEKEANVFLAELNAVVENARRK